MSKHLIKQLDRQIDYLRSQVFYLIVEEYENGIHKKIINWLEEEIEHNEPVLNGNEELSDGTEDIYKGRSECAKALLNQIKKWEKQYG
jgi:hypothetical protein